MIGPLHYSDSPSPLIGDLGIGVRACQYMREEDIVYICFFKQIFQVKIYTILPILITWSVQWKYSPVSSSRIKQFHAELIS